MQTSSVPCVSHSYDEAEEEAEEPDADKKTN